VETLYNPLSGGLGMVEVVTLKQRDERERMRRRAAADEMIRELQGYVARSGGRFIVFGSAVRDKMRHGSDIDVIVDFPDELRSEAWRFVEDLGYTLDLPTDILEYKYLKAAFLDRALTSRIEIV
jgi:predicted nucleotidyltransferase